MRSDADELRHRTGAVIVAHSRTDLALRCINSLDLPVDNVVVVINAPEYASPADTAELQKRARVVSPSEIQGYGANLNLGVRSLSAAFEFLLLANDDVEFSDDALDRLLARLERDAGLGIVGPAFRESNGRSGRVSDPFPTALNVVLSVALLPLGPAWRVLSERAGQHVYPNTGEKLVSDGFIIGAAMLVRASAYESIGGFDEDFFLYFEEADFCFRLRAAGWKIGWVSDASVLHLGGSSTPDARYRLIGLQSRRLYLLKRLGRARVAALEWAQAIVFGLACVYNALAAIARPATARRRAAQLHERYEEQRIFLLSSGPSPRWLHGLSRNRPQ
jgi:GT2 family glycosyltransferase